jgi:hypothetical protein
LASYKVNDIVETEFGVVNGDWNHADSVAVSGAGGNTANGSDSVALLASVNVKSQGGNANLKNTIIGQPTGGRNDVGTPAGSTANEGSAFLWDMWGNWAPKFANDKLLLGFNTDFGFYNDYANNGARTNTNETYWGAALYAKYQFTKLLSLAGRAEYAHNTDNAKFGNEAVGSRNADLWAYTLTAGFNIWENMLLKTEYRADFGNDAQTTTGGTTDKVAHMAAVQVVYSF